MAQPTDEAGTKALINILYNLDCLIMDAVEDGNYAVARRYADAASTILSDYADQYDRNKRPTVYNSPVEHLHTYETAQAAIARYPMFKDALSRAAKDALNKARTAFTDTYTYDPDKRPEAVEVAPNVPINTQA